MELLGSRPGRRAALYFFMAIVVGALVLLLPMSTRSGSITFVDALFTATSAVCVTGLTVLDTSKDFTVFGQLAILFLLQLGGLGIMTFATMLLASVGSRLSVLDSHGLYQSFGRAEGFRASSLIKPILLTTVILESLGALALFVRFRADFPPDQAAYHAVFHSISAFCNAGFSTFPDSLQRYNGDMYITLVFSLLIICGGLGFVVITELFQKTKQHSYRLSLHSRLCLAVTSILLVGGTALVFFAERGNILSDMPVYRQATIAFFQAVTSRTAGFNTVPQSALTELGLLVTMILMFIGACPGSTGGGIKTTTIGIILLVVWNRFRGRHSVTAFKRTISQDSIVRAITIFLLAMLVITLFFGLFMSAEQVVLPHLASHGWFVNNLFEVISAFGTVGLSLGITPHLNPVGKLLLTVLMFTGRVGLLTLAFALARTPEAGEIVYLDEDVLVG